MLLVCYCKLRFDCCNLDGYSEPTVLAVFNRVVNALEPETSNQLFHNGVPENKLLADMVAPAFMQLGVGT